MLRRLFYSSLIVLFILPVFSMAQKPCPTSHKGFGEHRKSENRQGRTMKRGHHFNKDRHQGFAGLFSIPMQKETLDLTDEQIKKMDQIIFNHKNDMIDMNAKIKKTSLLLRREMRKEILNKAEILKLHREKTELRNKVKFTRLEKGFEIYDILTDQQKTKFSEKRRNYCYMDK